MIDIIPLEIISIIAKVESSQKLTKDQYNKVHACYKKFLQNEVCQPIRPARYSKKHNSAFGEWEGSVNDSDTFFAICSQLRRAEELTLGGRKLSVQTLVDRANALLSLESPTDLQKSQVSSYIEEVCKIKRIEGLNLQNPEAALAIVRTKIEEERLKEPKELLAKSLDSKYGKNPSSSEAAKAQNLTGSLNPSLKPKPPEAAKAPNLAGSLNPSLKPKPPEAPKAPNLAGSLNPSLKPKPPEAPKAPKLPAANLANTARTIARASKPTHFSEHEACKKIASYLIEFMKDYQDDLSGPKIGRGDPFRGATVIFTKSPVKELFSLVNRDHVIDGDGLDKLALSIEEALEPNREVASRAVDNKSFYNGVFHDVKQQTGEFVDKLASHQKAHKPHPHHKKTKEEDSATMLKRVGDAADRAQTMIGKRPEAGSAQPLAGGKTGEKVR